MKERIHFIHKDIVDPTDPVSITLIGCGGTGTRLISELVRMNIMLLKLGNRGINVCVVDGDTISNSNIGRQLYYEDDIGRNKAEVTIERINQNFGFNWSCVNEYANEKFDKISELFKTNTPSSNFMISCVDTISARKVIYSIFNSNYYGDSHESYSKKYYYLDCGNSYDKGQVILGSRGSIEQPKLKQFKTIDHLKDVFQFFGNSNIDKAIEGEDKQASCSTYEALERQDPFINSTIAMLAAKIIWNLIRNHSITEHGYFVNLKEQMPITALLV